MKRILITGATGNIGKQVIKYLSSGENEIFAGVRNNGKIDPSWHDAHIKPVQFDFENASTFQTSLQAMDTLFLLRPPQLSDINIFKPLIDAAKHCNIREIMFLSVQGAEKSKIIPHNKIEKLIIESGLEYIFIRPSYFMQNLTTTLFDDIKHKRQIILPAGKAKFNWVDIDNIAEVCAYLINDFSSYKNQAYEVTGYENVNFQNVTLKINTTLTTNLIYRSLNPFSFYFFKRKEGEISAKILVMIMLHYLPRFSKEPQISNFYEKITGKNPTVLEEFIERERSMFI